MAAPRAKLWNDNDYDYENFYQGEKFVIPAKKFIEGDLYQMSEMKGIYKQATWLDDIAKIQDPKTFSRLRLEVLTKEAAEVGFRCMKCKTPCPSEKTLALHMEEAHPNAPKLESVDDIPQATHREAFTQDSPTAKTRASGKHA